MELKKLRNAKAACQKTWNLAKINYGIVIPSSIKNGRGVKGMSQKSVEKDRIKGIKIPDCFFIINVLQ